MADRENRRIQIFDSNGNYVEQWVNLSKAAAICVDNNGGGLVYVGEYYAGGKSNTIGADLGPRVTIFDPGGNVVARLGRQSFGDEPGALLLSPRGRGGLARRHLRGGGLLQRLRAVNGAPEGVALSSKARQERLTE